MLKHVVTSILFIVVVVRSSAAEGPIHVSLDGEWDFTYTGTSTAEVPDLPSAVSFDSTVTVPGRWDDQLERMTEAKWWPQAVFRTAMGPVQFLSGIGWHRKVIDVPADWAGRAAKITIGSAAGTTNMWLNGKHLGTSQFTVYTPFEIDVTGKLQAGKPNELIIAVDNSPKNIFGGWTYLGNAGMASGLSRPVTLDLAAGPGRIADLYTRAGADLKEVVWTAELMSPGLAEATPPSKLQWIVRDATSNHELGRGEIEVPSFAKRHQLTWKNRFCDIKPWSDREPNLYRTELRWITNDAQLWDTIDQRFGLRRWSYEGRKLFLNGHPHYLRLEFGVYYFPISGAVSMSKEFWLQHMRRVKGLGLNGINFASQVCPIEMMEAADELGVILQCGDQMALLETNRSHYRDVWNAIVPVTRRHPSVAIYGFGGEHRYYDGIIEQSKRQKELIQSLHDNSLVMPQQAIHGIDYGVLDDGDPGVKLTPFIHHSDRLARYTDVCDLFGHFSGGAFSHAYFEFLWREMEERFKIYDKPVVAHELFLSASYLRPTNAAKYTGRIPPYIYTRLEKELNEAGLSNKWPTYFDHTSRLQHICRKYCMEKVRKCNELAGFELLGMMDMHFVTPEYAVGMVDEFLEMKPGDTVEGIRRYSNESVLLLDFDNGNSLNRCYWAGEPFEAEVMASLFGLKELKKGELKWVLSNGDKTYNAGDIRIDAATGGVSTLKKLRFFWPTVQKTTRLNLSVTLNGSGYSLSNDWDFWVFPKLALPTVRAAADAKSLHKLQGRYPGVIQKTPASKERLRIVGNLSQNNIRHMEQGGDVLLLGAAPFTEYTLWPYFYPAKGYRPFSNGGTIIADHPVLESHPNEGWNDWPFFSLMQGANCILFDGEIDVVFDPIMEIISSAGHVRKQALVFEARVGKGRLFVSTLAFDPSNASSASFMDSMLRYVQSDRFAPQHSIDAQELIRATSPRDSGNWVSDPGFEKSGYWVTESGNHEIEKFDVREGRKCLKLVISEKDYENNRDLVSSVSQREISYSHEPRQLKLAAWFKTELSNKDAAPRVMIRVNYGGSYRRRVEFVIECKGKSDDWQYVEKTFDVDGMIINVNAFVELRGAAGTVLVDGLYFGEPSKEPQSEAPIPSAASDKRESGMPWSSEKVTRKFDSPVWYKFNNGEWARGVEAAIDREGAHKLYVKSNENDSKPTEFDVNIDLTPPLVTLKVEPLPNQEAGIFTATKDAVYSLDAADTLSGIKSIEVATDGKNFSPYRGPFKLDPGNHKIVARAIDHAGNANKLVTGEWITGSAPEALDVQVR